MTMQPIVVGGFYRSGTTLLRRLLDSHSRIHCSAEVKFFKDFFGDYQSDALAHVRFFSTVRCLGLPEVELLDRFGAAFIGCRDLAARRAGKVRWADKCPENVLYLAQWASLLSSGFFFIHVVRNPFDALASLNEVGFPKAVPHDFEAKVQLYKRFREAGSAYCAAHPDSGITVHYEDLVQAPERTLTTLFQALGEGFEPQVLEMFALPERGSGIEDPKIGRALTVHSDSLGRGRRALSVDEMACVERLLPASML